MGRAVRKGGSFCNDTRSRIPFNADKIIWLRNPTLAAMDRCCDDCRHAHEGNTSTDVDLSRAYLWVWAMGGHVSGAPFSRVARPRPLAACHSNQRSHWLFADCIIGSAPSGSSVDCIHFTL